MNLIDILMFIQEHNMAFSIISVLEAGFLTNTVEVLIDR